MGRKKTFFNLHKLPKLIRQHTNSQAARMFFFTSARIFSDAQNVWALVKFFFNLSKVLEIIRQHKSYQNPKRFQTSGFFHNPSNIYLGIIENFQLSLSSKEVLKFSNCPNFFSPHFLKQKWFFLFNLCNLPEMIKHQNNSQTAKLFQASCENISRVPKLWAAWKKIPQVAQTFCIVWRTPQSEQFNIRLN